MTPADFTTATLVGWGGSDCFNQALSIAKRGGVVEAHWDDFDHVITGKISMASGWDMPSKLEVLDDGTIISHCPCRTNKEFGQVCPHVVALGLYMMVQFMPEEGSSTSSVQGPAATTPKTQPTEDEDSVAEVLKRYVPMTPRIKATLSGSRASLSIILEADYKGALWECGELGPADEVVAVDPDDPYLFYTRNLPAEAAAIELVKRHHFEDIPPETIPKRYYITEPRNVLNFLGSGLPALRRKNWIVRLSDRLMEVADAMPMIVPVVTVSDAPRGAFDVGYEFDSGGIPVSQAEIQLAINRGDSYVMTPQGTVLLDAESIGMMRDVFSDCASQGGAAPGHFRVGNIYAPYVRAALESIGSVELEDEEAPNWRETASQRNRDARAKYEPVPLGSLENTLRPYQKQGVYWMSFLERSGLSGLLADEMGLGKTLQTLTWISLQRFDPAARGKPALVVCPTSLVRNWESEAAKFTPGLKRLVVSGPDRAKTFRAIPSADLVITSYALLQRDLEDAYLGVEFSVVVLDEAQHIKNRQTRNAKAAKELRAVQKLVLTGTPVENSVADVWSIFDFLLPGYLGDYSSFRDTTEQPIALGGNEGAAAQEKLHHKLHPFILRRLKKDVAKDLPDKIIKVAYCPMTPDQQRISSEIRAKAKAAKTKFEMLAVLMRLRQAANHMELLKEKSNDPSGKIETFFELLDEAMDGGHRVLVFSQFVSMLAILRRELEARQIKYCYLDGETKDRLGECRRFNSDETIPLFLISLHAGGTGLNLTGADMVVHFDPWWNPAVEAQATDRAHRIGQKKTVYVVKMIAEGSVEERVLALQQKKQLVIDATVGSTDEALVAKMSFDDLRAVAGI